jgi:hypothetical protein
MRFAEPNRRHGVGRLPVDHEPRSRATNHARPMRARPADLDGMTSAFGRQHGEQLPAQPAARASGQHESLGARRAGRERPIRQAAGHPRDAMAAAARPSRSTSCPNRPATRRDTMRAAPDLSAITAVRM